MNLFAFFQNTHFIGSWGFISTNPRPFHCFIHICLGPFFWEVRLGALPAFAGSMEALFAANFSRAGEIFARSWSAKGRELFCRHDWGRGRNNFNGYDFGRLWNHNGFRLFLQGLVEHLRSHWFRPQRHGQP
eukprot:UN27022